MNAIKIAVMSGTKFLDFYEVKEYAIASIEQFVVKQYDVNFNKILIDKNE